MAAPLIAHNNLIFQSLVGPASTQTMYIPPFTCRVSPVM